MPASWPEAPVSLNMLSARWRVALTTAADAIAASQRCPSPTLTPSELHDRAALLTKERERVSTLLEAIAREERLPLTRHLVTPTTSRARLGLPQEVVCCLFDLDGVLTPSADLHFAAWADVLDAFLARRFESASVHYSHYARLSRRTDYDEYLHGRPRLDGVRGFLASRGITASAQTVQELADAKNRALLHRLEEQGLDAFAGSVRYLEEADVSGLACGVVSASANTASLLEHAGLTDLIDVRVDGNTMRRAGLRAKPEPDTLLAACEALGVEPRLAAAFETTTGGIRAARAAGLGFVVGVDRAGDAPELTAAGADLVVTDLADLLGSAAGFP
jgi:HAD superfamily hydrolase (TIGR01509 family)